MNIIPATIGSADGAAVLQTAGGAFPVTRDMVSTDQLSSGRSLAVGVRPEDIAIDPGHNGGLHGTIEVIESMGSGNVVYIRLGKERIAVTTGPNFTAAFDDPVTLTLDPAKTLLFDPQTENRVV
jgi:ABC-type sugar transport system ATPase subunit